MISFAKMSSVQFVSFSYTIRAFPTTLQWPSLPKIEGNIFLVPQDIPYQPFSNHQEGKYQYNHGIVFVATTAVSSQPNCPCFWCVPHVFPGTPQDPHGSAHPALLPAQHSPCGRCRHKHSHGNTDSSIDTPTKLEWPISNSMQKLDFGQSCLTSAPSLLLTVSPEEMCWNIQHQPMRGFSLTVKGFLSNNFIR